MRATRSCSSWGGTINELVKWALVRIHVIDSVVNISLE